MAKILIVEDDPFVQRFYKRLFEVSKLQVEMASDGQEGLRKAREMLPDLILLDIVMPKLGGMDVLALLKTDEATKNIPIVMLTVLNDQDTVKKATRLGASGFIIKSEIEPEKLLEKVSEYIRG